MRRPEPCAGVRSCWWIGSEWWRILPLRPSVGVSPAGVLAYQTATDAGSDALAWFDRSGKPVSPLPPAASGVSPRLSPDGRFAATLKRSTTGSDIWLIDLSRGSSTRFTFAKAGQSYSGPVWSPDGKRVAYRLADSGICVKAANGVGAEEVLLKTDSPAMPLSWSPDGRQILFRKQSGLYLLPLGGGQAPAPIAVAGSGGNVAQISPDGKYFAFSSTEIGPSEVYVSKCLRETASGRFLSKARSSRGGAETERNFSFFRPIRK